MLSSNSSCYNQEPIPNYTHFPENDTTFSLFPTSPHMHLEYQDFYLQFLDLFYQHQETTPTAAKMAADSNENAVVKEGASRGKPAMRSSKKDRHSKINTARGPRDRRMRLSLDIARKFFDLQDLLGYDKASRTVEWLLRNSAPAIKELARAHNNYSNRPCSDQSSTCEEECGAVSSAVVPSTKNRMRREKVKRVVGRATVARESRRKARERARERTSQKKRLVNQTSEDPMVSGHLPNLVYDMQEPWNPSAVFNYHEENAAFLNNQDEQIEEFQFSEEPWETLSSFNLSG